MTARLTPEEVASAGIRPAELFLIFSMAELGSWVTSRREQGRQAKDVGLAINVRVRRK